MTDRATDRATLAAIWLGALALYCLIAPVGLAGADSPEFATLMVSPGAAHPPGYPLYTIYLRAFAWLPGQTVAHTAALATALLGATTVMVLAAAARRWGADRYTSALAAILIGVELNVFALHTHAEVFALNNLIAAAILYAAAPQPTRSPWTAGLLGLLAGLGISNHHSIVLLAPVGLWALVRVVRGCRSRPTAVGLAIAGGLLGLTPYLYLLGNPPPCAECLSWGRLESFADLWHHFTRADYGSTTLKTGGEQDPVAQLAAFAERFATGSWMLVPVAAAAGLAAVWRNDRAQAAALGGTFALCGPVFIAVFNIPPEGIGAELVARFYALPIVAAMPLVALGVQRLKKPGRAMLAAAVLLLGGVNAARVVHHNTGVLDAYLRDILEPLPPDAIVFATGDHRTFGAAYMQLAEGVRTDVIWVDAKALAYGWYAERVEARLGSPLPRSSPTVIPLDDFLAAALATGRPVFATHVFADNLLTLPTYPIGPVIRILPAGQAPPDPRTLAAQNAELVSGFHLSVKKADVESPWELEAYPSYARPWQSLAPALERMGDADGARRSAEMQGLFE